MVFGENFVHDSDVFVVLLYVAVGDHRLECVNVRELLALLEN